MDIGSDKAVFLPTSAMIERLRNRAQFIVRWEILHAAPNSGADALDVVRMKIARPAWPLTVNDDAYGIEETRYPNLAARGIYRDGRSDERRRVDDGLGLRFPVDETSVLSDEIEIGSDDYIQSLAQVVSRITGGITDDDETWSIDYDLYAAEFSLTGEFMLSADSVLDANGKLACKYEIMPSGRLRCRGSGCYFRYREHMLEGKSDIELLSGLAGIIAMNARSSVLGDGDLGELTEIWSMVMTKYLTAELLARSSRNSSSFGSFNHNPYIL